MSLAGVREWLALNKIFFETISAVALAVAAILISSFQAVELSQQNQLIALQTKMEAAKDLPNFEFEPKIKDDGSEVLSVKNTGEAPTDLKIDATYIVKIAAISNEPLKVADLKIELADYYESDVPIRASKGEVAVLTAPNGKMVVDTEAKIRSAVGLFKSISVRGATGLRIEYKDLIGHIHVQYFEVRRNIGTRDGDTLNGESIFSNIFGGWGNDEDIVWKCAAFNNNDVVKILQTRLSMSKSPG